MVFHFASICVRLCANRQYSKFREQKALVFSDGKSQLLRSGTYQPHLNFAPTSPQVGVRKADLRNNQGVAEEFIAGQNNQLHNLLYRPSESPNSKASDITDFYKDVTPVPDYVKYVAKEVGR